MTEEQNGNMEFFIRTSFVILILKIVALQLALGLFYFLALIVLDLSESGITAGRLITFFIFQSLQALFSVLIFLRWFYLSYEINEKEITCHKGIIAKNTECYSLEKVESVKVKQGLWGAFFKFGSLEVSINHSDHRDIVCIKNISRPRRHAKIIEKVLKNFV